MKRYGNLYERICSWDNLEFAARLSRRRKRYRLYTENVELRRESVLRQSCLWSQLLNLGFC